MLKNFFIAFIDSLINVLEGKCSWPSPSRNLHKCKNRRFCLCILFTFILLMFIVVFLFICLPFFMLVFAFRLRSAIICKQVHFVFLCFYNIKRGIIKTLVSRFFNFYKIFQSGL